MPTITPYLWFDTRAEEAMQFYTSIFKDSRVLSVSRAGDKAMTVQFELQGQKFIGLNAGMTGPEFTFNDSVSFLISVETQSEIDYYWDRLTAGGGRESRCGWLRDKFGLAWQVVPSALGRMLTDPDPAKAQAVMSAMLTMNKLDLAALEHARASA